MIVDVYEESSIMYSVLIVDHEGPVDMLRARASVQYDGANRSVLISRDLSRVRPTMQDGLFNISPLYRRA